MMVVSLPKRRKEDVAHFHPDREVRKPNPGELAVRDAIERSLGNGWHVIMQPSRFVPEQVRWDRYGGAPEEEEHDFLLLHVDYGALVLEVKGGSGWIWTADKPDKVSTPDGKVRPSPLEQGRLAQEWLRQIGGSARRRSWPSSLTSTSHGRASARMSIHRRRSSVALIFEAGSFELALTSRVARWDRPRDPALRQQTIDRVISRRWHFRDG